MIYFSFLYDVFRYKHTSFDVLKQIILLYFFIGMENSLIDRIKSVMKTIGVNQVVFAEKTGMRQQNISRILNGKVNIGDAVINKIVLSFDVNKDWLLTGVGSMFDPINGKIPKGNIVYFPHVQKSDYEKYITNYNNQEYIDSLDPFPVKEFPITYESGKMAFDVIDNAMKVGDARFKVSTGDVVIARNINKDYSKLSDKEIYVIVTNRSIFIRLCKVVSKNEILLSPGDKALFDDITITKDDILVLYHAYSCFIS